MSAHSSIIGGSTAKRGIACPGSIKLCQKMPPSQENEYTIRGTLCHMAIDSALATSNPARVIGMKYRDQTLTEELYSTKIEPALALFEQVDPERKMEFVTENEVSFGDHMPGVFGTADVIGRIDDTVVVLDWKFGDGVVVPAEENYQGLFYAAAGKRTPALKWAFDGAKQVEIIIIQPPMISRWTCPIERLDSFEAELIEALKMSERQDAPIVLGDHCRFCTAKPICPQMTGAVDRAIATGLKSLDPVKINEYLKQADIIEGFIADLRSVAHRMMEEGNIKLPDYKLVAKRAVRKWADDNKAAQYMEDAGIAPFARPELLSPAQAEKALKKVKKELPSDLVTAVSSGSTLVSKDDPRPEMLNIGASLRKALSKIQ